MIINFLESLIASYFFTNYFDLKINKYLYFMINFILISSVINLFDYINDYSIILPIIVALIAAIIAFIWSRNNYWEILFITFLDQLNVGVSIVFSLTLENLVNVYIRVMVGKIIYFLITYLILYICKTKNIKLNYIYWKLYMSF